MGNGCPHALGASSRRGEDVSNTSLPREILDVLWDVDPDAAWKDHPDFVVERVLSRGTWDAIGWIRSSFGDPRIRDVIRASRGRLLTRRQLRFWQLVLDLSGDEVDRWMAMPGRETFDRGAR